MRAARAIATAAQTASVTVFPTGNATPCCKTSRRPVDSAPVGSSSSTGLAQTKTVTIVRPEGPSGGDFTVQLSWMQIAIVVTTLTVLAIFTWLVTRTPLGRSMRACEQDLKMAGLLGIDTDQTISLTFVIGASLAAVAGLMFLLYYGVIDFYMGFVAGVKAFTAEVLGGIGSLIGSLAGGVILGVTEAVGSIYLPGAFRDAYGLIFVVAILLYQPSGLFGDER